jgi:hypothetical protein
VTVIAAAPRSSPDGAQSPLSKSPVPPPASLNPNVRDLYALDPRHQKRLEQMRLVL